jgi:hypothetical protein
MLWTSFARATALVTQQRSPAGLPPSSPHRRSRGEPHSRTLLLPHGESRRALCASHGGSAHRRQLGQPQVPQVLVERVGEDVVLARLPVGGAGEVVDEAVAVGGAAQD